MTQSRPLTPEAIRTRAEVTREINGGGVNGSGMQFFESRFVVIGQPYSEQLRKDVISALDLYLRRFGIKVERTVARDDYYNNTSSKKVNNYIVVKRRDMDEISKEVKETQELLQVGTTRYRLFEIFASVKYAMFSLAGMDLDDGSKVSVLWIHLHSRLYNVFEEFARMPFGVAEIISRLLSTTAYVMGMSPKSKSRDEFAMYTKGIQKENMSGRYILTEVKKSYGIDIVRVMETTDYNMSVLDAVDELIRAREEKKIHDRKISEMRADFEKYEELRNKTNERGEKLVDLFEAENTRLTDEIDSRLRFAARLVAANPIGCAVYFYINDVTKPVPGQSKTQVSNIKTDDTM